MKMKKKTADELLAELRVNPEFAQKKQEQELRRQARATEDRRDLEPVLRALEAEGIHIVNIEELGRNARPQAIAILLSWLPKIANAAVKEWIVRGLSVPLARPTAARPLIEELRRTPLEQLSLRWAICNALSVVADDSVIDDVLSIATEPGFGKAREMAVVALGNMTHPRALEASLRLLGDREVCGHAIMALGKIGSPSALPFLSEFETHPKAWIRGEAKKAIRQLRKKLV